MEGGHGRGWMCRERWSTCENIGSEQKSALALGIPEELERGVGTTCLCDTGVSGSRGRILRAKTRQKILEVCCARRCSQAKIGIRRGSATAFIKTTSLDGAVGECEKSGHIHNTQTREGFQNLTCRRGGDVSDSVRSRGRPWRNTREREQFHLSH